VPNARAIYFEPDVYHGTDSPAPRTEEIVIRSVD
jgi:hypothetical protein